MKTIWLLALVITVLLTVNAAYAQLNESDTARFQLRAGITGVWQSGNVELLVLRSRLEMLTNGKKTLFLNRKTTVYISGI